MREGVGLLVEVVPSWKCRWPRPVPDYVETIALQLSSSGDVGISERYARTAGAREHPVLAKWWTAYRQGCSTIQ
eukprot:12078542-Alexandrium_andersonii.AAC.1